MELNYDEIRRIHRFEKENSRLAELEPDFYGSLAEFIKKEKKDYLEGLKDFSLTKTRDFTNMKKMVEEIFSLREKKILCRVLVASRTKDFSEEIMPMQEKKLFGSMLSLLNGHNEVVEDIFVSESQREKGRGKEMNAVRIKILSDIPSFIGTDMKEYGPFSKGQAAEVPYKIAELLEGRKLGKIEEERGE